MCGWELMCVGLISYIPTATVLTLHPPSQARSHTRTHTHTDRGSIRTVSISIGASLCCCLSYHRFKIAPSVPGWAWRQMWQCVNRWLLCRSARITLQPATHSGTHQESQRSDSSFICTFSHMALWNINCIHTDIISMAFYSKFMNRKLSLQAQYAGFPLKLTSCFHNEITFSLYTS